MAKYFYILNHRFLPTPYSHRFFVEKFGKGFAYHGYEVKLVERAGEIDGPGFLMTSKVPFFFYWNDGVKNIRRNFFMLTREIFKALKLDWFEAFCTHFEKRALAEIAPRMISQNVVLIAWDWHKEQAFIDSLGVPTIYTNDYYYSGPRDTEKKAWQAFYGGHPDRALPIRFLADYDPARVGDLADSERNIIVSYVGERRYALDWQGAFKDRSDCAIIPTPPYIEESKRIYIYQHTLISLGLGAPGNIANGVVTERVFEALAFGSICISNHPDAPAATDGVALYAPSLDDLVRKVDYFSKNPLEAKKIRERGFAFIKADGTYSHEAEKFIALAEAQKKRT